MQHWHIMLTSPRNWKMSSSAISPELAEQRDPGIHIYFPEKWHSWKNCGQKAIPPTWLQGEWKHRNWSAEKWCPVLWTDESKFDWSRRQFVRWRLEERYKNQCLQATVKYGGGSLQVGDLVRINGLHFCTVLYEVKWLFVIHSVRFLKFEHKSFYFLFVFERKRWRDGERQREECVHCSSGGRSQCWKRHELSPRPCTGQ